MYKSLDHAISRFESEDLTSIVVKITYRTLGEIAQLSISILKATLCVTLGSGVGVASGDQ